MLNLYYFSPASSLVSHLALQESGLLFDATPARPNVPEERARLLDVNPKGTVPTLTVDDTVLTENVAILSYVARRSPEAALMPREPIEEARCMSLLAWCASSVHVAFRQLMRPERFSAEPDAHPGLRSAARESFLSHLRTLEQMLDGQEWVMGSQYSVVDGYALLFFQWTLLAKLPTTEFPALTAHASRMLRRPAVHAVLTREGSPLASSTTSA